jgi:hypothetical protein
LLGALGEFLDRYRSEVFALHGQARIERQRHSAEGSDVTQSSMGHKVRSAVDF